MDDQFYTIEEVADKLKVTPKTIYEWMNEGRLAYVIVGKRRRITSSALQAFIQHPEHPIRQTHTETASPA